MANEERNREEKGAQDRQSEEKRRQAEKGGQHRDDDKSRREQNEQERSPGQRGRKS
jgi:hypothetical protein